MKGDTYSGFTLWNKNASFSKNEKEFFSENIRRILTTRKGERVNEPEFGSNIRQFLFMPQMYVSDLAALIKNDIEANEPRVTVKECTVKPNDQQDSVIISLVILVNNKTLDIEVGI